VVALAGQRPAKSGEWLVITEADSLPGSQFVAWVLPADDREAHGGDVLVRLAPGPRGSDLDPDTVDVSVWGVISGQLIPVAAWGRHNPDGWPEQIRPAVAFAMGMLAELEEHAGVWIGAYDGVNLDDAVAAATPGIPFRLTLRQPTAAHAGYDRPSPPSGPGARAPGPALQPGARQSCGDVRDGGG